MAANKAKIKKQVEYSLSVVNIARHKFFNDRIGEDKGSLLIQDILNCNKVKTFGLKNGAKDIVEAIYDSESVQADESGLKVHRKGTSLIPDLSVIKKRDTHFITFREDPHPLPIF